VAQVIEHLLCKCGALNSNPSPTKKKKRWQAFPQNTKIQANRVSTAIKDAQASMSARCSTGTQQVQEMFENNSTLNSFHWKAWHKNVRPVVILQKGVLLQSYSKRIEDFGENRKSWNSLPHVFIDCMYVYILTGFSYLAQAGLKLKILLPQCLECWEYWHVLPCLSFQWTLKTHQPGASLLGHSYTEKKLLEE
jgi:hypothetical protein